MREWHRDVFAPHEVEPLIGCDLCGHESRFARKLFDKSGLTVVRCRRCSLIYVNPRLRRDILWQRYADEYFENEYLPQHGEYNEALNSWAHAPFLKKLRQYVPHGGRMFEFGAATGLFLAAAQLDGWQVMGNELSQFAASYANSQFGIPVIPGNATEVQQAPGSYDAVVLWETIEHVESPRAVLRKAAELLRPGGVLALTTPNIGGVSFLFLRHRWWIVAPKEHIYYFSPKTIKYALGQAGFKVRSLQTAGTDLPFFYNTLLGRTVMPAHIREAEARAAGGDGAAERSRPGLAKATWLKVEPWLIPILRSVLHRAGFADQLVVYATKES